MFWWFFETDKIENKKKKRVKMRGGGKKIWERNKKEISNNNENWKYGEMKLNGMAKRKLLNKLVWPLRYGVSTPIHIFIMLRPNNVILVAAARILIHFFFFAKKSKSFSVTVVVIVEVVASSLFFLGCICVSICSSYSLVRMLYSDVQSYRRIPIPIQYIHISMYCI